MAATRLTTLDASFLEVESPSAHMHVGWAAAFAPPSDGPRPRFEQLRDHVAGRMARAPRYRQRLRSVPLGAHDPVWVDDDRFDVDRHVIPSTCGDLAALTDRVLSRQLRRDRPLWELWIADELDDGRIGVVGKAHHAMVDGVAAVELASLLLDPTPDTPPPEPDGWRPQRAPAPGALLADSVVERARDALDVALVPFELARRAGRLPARAAHGLQSALALADSLRPAPTGTGFNDTITSERHLARARRPLGDLKRAKGRFGATVNDVVLAASAGAIGRFQERRGRAGVPLKAMVPVSYRAAGGGADLGNQISFVFVDLPCDEPDPEARLARVQEEVGLRKRSGRPEGADRALKAAAYAPRPLRQALSRMVASPRTYNLVVSNIPGPPEPLWMLGCELEEVYPVVPLSDNHALSIGMTTVGDEAFFGIYTDRGSVPDADALAECLDEALDELTACC
jgi:diacylglycerol O-acyltransferase / wax synthase